MLLCGAFAKHESKAGSWTLTATVQQIIDVDSLVSARRGDDSGSDVDTVGEVALDECWPDASTSTEWVRRRGDKRFVVARRHGRPVDPRWDAGQVATAVGAAFSVDDADDASDGHPAWFPQSFRYSPNTGKPLIAAEAGRIETWLPPNGNQNLRDGLVRGGRLTDVRLSLARSASSGSRPAEMPLPPPGHFRFLVAAHGLRTACLLALCRDNGTLFCWLSHRHEWAEVRPTPGCVYLGAERLSDEYWGLEATALDRDTILYWPCDRGLARVRIDPLCLTYEAELLVAGCCVSQPVVVADRIYVLMRPPESVSSGVCLVSLALADPVVVEREVDDVPDGDWTAVATPHEAIWISDLGQVVAAPKRMLFCFLPWDPPGIQPQLELGPPYCARNGHLWLQVMHPTANDGDEGPGYVSLGRVASEWRPSGGLRTLSGRSSIKVEERRTDDPWEEPKVVNSDSQHNDEAVKPILESTVDGSLLVLRVDHTDGIKKFFDMTGLQQTRFQIFGEQPDKAGFFSAGLRQPWNASAFVFEGALHLYHPDLRHIFWWPLASNASTAQPAMRTGA